MGFFGSILTAAVKVVVTPATLVIDAAKAVVDPAHATSHTKDLLESAAEDVEDAFDPD